MLWVSEGFVDGHLREVLHRNEIKRLIDGIPVFSDVRLTDRPRLTDAIPIDHIRYLNKCIKMITVL